MKQNKTKTKTFYFFMCPYRKVGLIPSSSLGYGIQLLCSSFNETMKGVRSILQRYNTFIGEKGVSEGLIPLVSIYEYLTNQFLYLERIGYIDIVLRNYIIERNESYDFYKSWSQSDYLIEVGIHWLIEKGLSTGVELKHVLPSREPEFRFFWECFRKVKRQAEAIST